MKHVHEAQSPLLATGLAPKWCMRTVASVGLDGLPQGPDPCSQGGHEGDSSQTYLTIWR